MNNYSQYEYVGCELSDNCAIYYAFVVSKQDEFENRKPNFLSTI